MIARWLCALAVLLTVLVGGCGGGSLPALLAGDYFPLVIGRVWQYNTVLEVETASDDFNTTGTMTRTLIGTEIITVLGQVMNTYVFQHDYTTSALPVLPGQASFTLLPFINYMFSDPGGLQSVRAYYRLVAATPDKPAHIELVAMSRVGGPIVPVTRPRPVLLNPPYHGAAQQTDLWFTPLPLMPFPTDLSDMQVEDKLLNFGVLGEIGGSANTVISIYFYGGNLTVDGDVAAIAGRGRSFFKDGVGLWSGATDQTDWYATLNLAGATARVTSRLVLVSVTP